MAISILYICQLKLYLMSLLNQQKGNNKKKGNKANQAASVQGSKFIAKGKSAGFTIKPHKAGGSRGS
jgi:hypothetical protein